LRNGSFTKSTSFDVIALFTSMIRCIEGRLVRVHAIRRSRDDIVIIGLWCRLDIAFWLNNDETIGVMQFKLLPLWNLPRHSQKLESRERHCISTSRTARMKMIILQSLFWTQTWVHCGPASAFASPFCRSPLCKRKIIPPCSFTFNVSALMSSPSQRDALYALLMSHVMEGLWEEITHDSSWVEIISENNDDWTFSDSFPFSPDRQYRFQKSSLELSLLSQIAKLSMVSHRLSFGSPFSQVVRECQ
jgi:hypothetical protein